MPRHGCEFHAVGCRVVRVHRSVRSRQEVRPLPADPHAPGTTCWCRRRNRRSSGSCATNDGTWTLTEAAGLDATLPVPSLGIEIALREVYDKVDFSEPAEEA